MRIAFMSAAFAFLFTATQAAAQLTPSDAQQGQPPEKIDLLIPQDADAPLEDCSKDQDAATISNEIVVCRRKNDGKAAGYDKERAENRYAAETMNKGAPRAPDMEHHYPGVVVARGCFIGPCPPPKAYMFDIKALPEAPPGSDADRIARGLAPLGNDAVNSAAVAKELALPPAPAATPAPATAKEEKVSPAGSASPEDAPPG